MKIFFTSILLLCSLGMASQENFVNISWAGFAFDYREYSDTNKLLDTERSGVDDVKGVDFAFSHKVFEGVEQEGKILFDVLYLKGYTQYVGSLLGSSQGYGSYYSITDNMLRNFSLLYEHTFALKRGFGFVYDVGGGYREWKRALSVVQVEWYQWGYGRLGAGIAYGTKELSIMFKGALEYAIAPQMLLEPTRENPQTILELGKTYILAFEVPLRYAINDRFSLTCKYIFHYQSITESNDVDYIINNQPTKIYEPKSTAYNQTLEIGVGYSF